MTTTYAWERLGAEIMDSRDLVAIADEIRDALAALNGENTLGGERDESLLEDLDCSTGSPDDDPEIARELLAAIEALAESGIEDWEYGATLIRDDYFEDYAQELAEDIGAVAKDAPWPACHIDWEAAADSLKQDYMCVTFQGSDYWARA